MRIEPASIDQLRRGNQGRMVLISADVGGVAADLKRIDPHLCVRFAENGNPPYWVVFWESDDGRQTYLVTTCQAVQTRSGVWTGLDQRLVARIREIDPEGGYDYAAELERANEQVRREKQHERDEQFGEISELAAHAARKDLGATQRAFIPGPKDAA